MDTSVLRSHTLSPALRLVPSSWYWSPTTWSWWNWSNMRPLPAS